MAAVYLLVAAALVGVAGFFAAAETAVLAANRMRLRHRAAAGDRHAARVLAVLERPDRFLTVVLLGNNVAVVGATALTTLAVHRYLGEIGTVAVASISVTALVTIFAEIIPKSAALRDPDYFAGVFADAVNALGFLFAPAVWVVNLVAGGLFRLVRVRAERLPFVTREELRAILTERRGKTHAEVLQRRMIRRIFRFGETSVARVMVPLAEVVSLPRAATVADVAAAVGRSGDSKVPVYDGAPANVVGVVLARDALGAPPTSAAASFMRAPLFASPDESVEAVLPILAERTGHIAVVRDAAGAAVGIVTQEDVVEEIVGEIEGEHGWGPHGLVRQADGYAADARLAVAYFNRKFPVPLPSGDYATLGGFLAARLGRVPTSGDELAWGPYRFRVLRATPVAPLLVAVTLAASEAVN